MHEWPAAWSRRRATLLSTPPLRRTATLRGFFSGKEHDKYAGSISFEIDGKATADSDATEEEDSGLRVEKSGGDLPVVGKRKRRRVTEEAQRILRRKGVGGKLTERADMMTVAFNAAIIIASLQRPFPSREEPRELR